MEELITANLDIWSAAVTVKASGAGRSSGNKGAYGINKLRELILELAVRGKLVPQDADDEPASELLKKIRKEKDNLIDEGKIKKDKPLPPITDEEKPFTLPVGWEWVRLNVLLEKIGAGSTPLGGKQVYTKHGIPFLRSQNVWDEGLRLDDVAFIPQETHEKMSGTHVFSGDLLFNITGASIGRCAVVPHDFVTGNVSQHVTIVRSVSKHILKYLHLVMISRHIQQTVMDVQVGVSREGLSIGKLAQFVIPIPPLSEQHRIVAKVDELMALCHQLETEQTNSADAHENLVSILLDSLSQGDNFTESWARLQLYFDVLFTTPASIDKLKQALLQLAVMGKLVPQDPNDESVSELLKEIRRVKNELIAHGKIRKYKALPSITAEERPFELPRGWEWVRLGECGITSTGGTPRSSDSHAFGGNIPFTGPGQISPSGELLAASKYLTREGSKQSSLAEIGDILMVCIGGSIGKSLVASEELAFNQQINCIKPIFIAARFLNAVMTSKSFQNELFSKSTGSATPIINRSKWEMLCIVLAPLAEQHRIVDKVDELMALCDQVKAQLVEAGELQRKLADVMVERAVA